MHVLYHLPFICLFCNLIRKVKNNLARFIPSKPICLIAYGSIIKAEENNLLYSTSPCIYHLPAFYGSNFTSSSSYSHKTLSKKKKKHLHNGDKVCGKKPRNRSQGIENFVPKSASSDLNKLHVLKLSSAARSTNQPATALQHSLSFSHMKSLS